MRLLKYSLVLCTFLMQVQYIQAQEIMRGYYVDSGDQRREAEFKFNFDLENYEQFVVVHGNRELVLTPDLAKEVSLENGRLFQSVVLTEGNEKVFALVIRAGDIDLLKWQRGYFIRKSDEIVALKELSSTKVVNGQETKVVTKQYQGVLLSILRPSPDQEQLTKAIRASGLNDRDLSNVIDLYHELNGLILNQKVIQKQGKAFVAKLKLQAGVGMQSLMKNFENQGFVYELQSGWSPYFEAGVRFKVFRNSPRLFVDLGIAYYAESDEVLAEVSKISFDLQGKQAFTSRSIVIPFQLNYILSKRNSTEWYGGVGLSFWISSYKNDSAEVILDNGEPDLITHSEDFVSRKPGSISSNVKLGWSKDISAKSQVFVEAKGDLLLKNYEFTPLIYYANYNLGVLTFSAGFTF